MLEPPVRKGQGRLQHVTEDCCAGICCGLHGRYFNSTGICFGPFFDSAGRTGKAIIGGAYLGGSQKPVRSGKNAAHWAYFLYGLPQEQYVGRVVVIVPQKLAPYGDGGLFNAVGALGERFPDKQGVEVCLQHKSPVLLGAKRHRGQQHQACGSYERPVHREASGSFMGVASAGTWKENAGSSTSTFTEE